MIAVRRARHEPRRIGGEDGRERRCHDISELVVLDAVPHVEEEGAARLQDAPRFRERFRLVREEHDAELADDRVERRVRKRQLHRVRLAPFNRARRSDRRRVIEHRLVEIGGDNRRGRGER